jgi:hypothetical protein
MPGDGLRFEVVSLEEARKALFTARAAEEKARRVL